MVEHHLHHERHRLFDIGIRVGLQGVDPGHLKEQRTNNDQTEYLMKHPGYGGEDA
jgi:hypothetical protein